ncbi:hypothetical protein ACQEU3_02045 [Spirillospora sp. CA-253888]
MEIGRLTAPDAGRLVTDPAGVRHWPGLRLGLVRGEADVVAYEPVPEGGLVRRAAFPRPWPDFEYETSAVSPDLRFAVFGGPDRVRAVDAAGWTLWEIPHVCWPDRVGRGSLEVTADGARVWAHVGGPVRAEDAPEEDPDAVSAWLVIDARDGRPLAERPLECSEHGSEHFLHPDGEHVLFNLGGEGCVAGRLGPAGLELLEIERPGGTTLVVAVAPDGRHLLTLDDAMDELTLEPFPPRPGGPADFPCVTGADASWDLMPGFLDDGRILAAEDLEEYRVTLLSRDGLRPLGRVALPDVQPGVNVLGDGTWLTLDRDGVTVRRWRL